MSRACRELEAALARWPDWSEAERDACRAHAASCAACAERLAALEALDAHLPSLQREHEALPPHFDTRARARKTAVLEAIEEAGAPRLPWRSLLAGAAAALAVLALLRGDGAPPTPEATPPPLTLARTLRVGGMTATAPSVDTSRLRPASLSSSLSKARRELRRPSAKRFRFTLPRRPQANG